MFNTIFPKIHKEGYKFLAISIIATFIVLLFSKFLGLILILITIWVYYFFRDPERISINDDKLGPYVKKHIDFGTDISSISEVPTAIHVENMSHDFKNTLVGPISATGSANYVGPNTSLALNAELHDIRIYNRHIQNVEELICKKSIKDFNDENLIFSVPAFYYESDVKRKGLVNLHGLNSTNNNKNEINDDNLIINGPVNSYFSNKCLGHEVSVENFIVEFKKKVSPNFIINNSFADDASFRDSWNIIAYDSDFEEVDDNKKE